VAGYYVTFHWTNYECKNCPVWNITKTHRNVSLLLWSDMSPLSFINCFSPLISKARNFTHLLQLASLILMKLRNRHTRGSNPNYGITIHTKRTLGIVAVQSYGINYLKLLNKFSPKAAVRYTICSSVPQTFCTKLCILSTIVMWNNINLIHECSVLSRVLNKFSYVFLPEHVNTCATRTQSILNSSIFSHSEHICWAHILFGTVRNIPHAVQDFTFIPYQTKRTSICVKAGQAWAERRSKDGLMAAYCYRFCRMSWNIQA